MTNFSCREQPDPVINYGQEVRFAVVMYGGISLAIYMNGVAQEMLRLVKATAPAGKNSGGVKFPNAELKGTECIYRKLGQMLQRGGPPLPLSELEKNNEEIKTRFVVDVISGTSAGGINGVFLAKALANNESIDQLTNLWIEEGDFGRLLNDKKDPSSGTRRETHSLLDGRHMYRTLLKALEGMDASAPATPGPSPYVEELDLFVTATDISGLTLPLKLADGVVKERRHRNVFHFVYTTPDASGEDINDFKRENNPFLAFAARSTSSFPVAFEPMKLSYIDDVLGIEQPYRSMSEDERKEYLSGSDRWKVFYEDYVRAQQGSGLSQSEMDFTARAFSDGGALDNKPFSYATDALLRRRADLPVERKLVFVDPDPQNPDKDPYFNRDIDVLENTGAALSPTVSTETIREDIQRILERNRLIERVKHITEDVEHDVAMWGGERHAGPMPGDVWAGQDLQGMINRKGIAYGGYQRLKISVLTDELASYVTNAANFDVDSDQFLAIRYFVRVWRELAYDKVRLPDSTKPTLNQFVMDFDLGYRLRRLNFIRAKINELSGLNPPQLFETLRRAPALGGRGGALPQAPDSQAELRDSFQSALRQMLRAMGAPQKDILRLRRKYGIRGANNPLSEHFKIQPQTLEYVLNQATDARRYEAAELIMRENWSAALVKFETVAERLRADFRDTTTRASALCGEALSPEQMTSDSPGEQLARVLLWDYYQGYEDYDMVIFPVTHQTGVGETVAVDVVRVSPYDSTNLIDEKAEDTKTPGRHKLGGTALGHFGAFLEKSWRKNDIMWGRLDAAERIISTLLPEGHPDAAALIDEAHLAILGEEMLPGGEAELRALYVKALAQASAGVANAEVIRRVREQFAASPPNNPVLKSVLDSCVDPETLLGYFKDADKSGGYEVDRRLDPEAMVKLIARASTILGRMLETLAEKHGADRRHAARVTRLGQVFWGFVEVAVPRTLPNLLARHFIKVLYVFGALMVAGGVLLVYGEMLRFGLLALAVTGVTHAAVRDLGDYIRGGRFKRLKAAAVLFVLVLSVPLVVSAILGFKELWGEAVAAYSWFIELPPLALIRRIQPPFLRALAFLSVPVLLFALGALLVGGLKVISGGRTGQST